MKTDEIKARNKFDTAIGKRLCPAAKYEYFESEPEIFTRNLDRYEDDEEHQTHMPEVDDITPEAMYNYIGANIMVSHGDTMAQGIVRIRKHDVEENTIGGTNSNPILYS